MVIMVNGHVGPKGNRLKVWESPFRTITRPKIGYMAWKRYRRDPTIGFKNRFEKRHCEAFGSQPGSAETGSGSSRGCPTTTTKADLFRQTGSALRIAGRCHWMFSGKVPACTILVDAQPMARIEMPSKHLAAPAAFEADDVIAVD
jgi:hypothetical protein